MAADNAKSMRVCPDVCSVRAGAATPSHDNGRELDAVPPRADAFLPPWIVNAFPPPWVDAFPLWVDAVRAEAA